jgi:hypothetical protein
MQRLLVSNQRRRTGLIHMRGALHTLGMETVTHARAIKTRRGQKDFRDRGC